MKILKAKEFIGEKLNIQPISKERLDSYGKNDLQSMLETKKWIEDNKDELEDKILEIFSGMFENDEFSELAGTLFDYGQHLLIDENYNVSLMFITPNDSIEIYAGTKLYSYLKKIKGRKLDELSNKGLNYWSAAGGWYLGVDSCYLEKMADYFKKDKNTPMRGYNFTVEYTEDEGGSVYVSVQYRKNQPKKFDTFVKEFYEKAIKTANEYINHVFNEVNK